MSKGYSAEDVAGMRGMSAEAVKAAQGIGALRKEVDGADDSKRKLRDRLKELRQDSRGLTTDMHGLHSAARGLASGFDAMWLTWGSTLPLVAGAAISGAFVGAVKSGMEFADTMNRIGVLSGETSESMQSLQRSALDLGGTGIHGPLEMAQAMKTLSMAGLSVGQIGDSIGTVSKFATVGALDLNAAAEGLVAIGTAYGYSAREFSVVSDLIAVTANGSMASVESMTESFRQASVVAQQYGVKLQDTALMLGLLSQVGIKGSAAGTALRNMYTELMGSSKKARQVLKDTLGLEVWDETKKGMKDVSQIFGELLESLSSRSTKAQQTILQTLGNERGTKSLSTGLKAQLTQIGVVAEGSEGMVKRLRSALESIGSQGISKKFAPEMAALESQAVKSGQVSAHAIRKMQEDMLATLSKPGVNKAAKAQAEQIQADYEIASKASTTQFKEFQKLLEEAPGYTALKEFDINQSALNQTKMAFNTLQKTLVDAFLGAEPALNRLIHRLKDAAGSSELQASVTGLVQVLSGLGNMVMNNADGLLTLVKVYAAVKGAALLYSAASAAMIPILRAGSAAMALQSTIAGGIPAIYKAIQVWSGTAATAQWALASSGTAVGVGAAAAATGVRALVVAMGPLVIAISAGIGLWMMYKQAQDQAIAGPGPVAAGAELLRNRNKDLDAEITRLEAVKEEMGKGVGQVAAELRAAADEAGSRTLEETQGARDALVAGVKTAETALKEHQRRMQAVVGEGKQTYNMLPDSLVSALGRANEALREHDTKVSNTLAKQQRVAALSKEIQKAGDEQRASQQLLTPSGLVGFDPDAKTGSADRDRIVAARKARDNELAELQKHYQTQTSRLESSLSTQKSILDNSRSAMEITEGTYRANELTLQSRHESASLEQAQSYLADYTDAWARAVQDRVEAYNEFIAANQGKQGFAEALKTQTEALSQDAENLGRVFETTTEKVEADIAKTQDGIRVRSAKMASEAAGAVNKYKKALEDLARAEKRRSEDASGRANLERASIGMSERAITAMQAEFEERKRIADMVRNYEDDIRESKKEEIDYINEINKLQDGGQWTDVQVEGLTQIVSKTNAASKAMGSLVDNTENMVGEAKNLALFELETKQIAKLTDDLAGAVMTGLLEGGEQGKEALRKILVAELSKPITLVVKAIVQPIAAWVNSGVQSALGFAGGLTGVDAGGSGSSALGTAKTAYDTFTTGIRDSLASGFDKLVQNSLGEKLGLSHSYGDGNQFITSEMGTQFSQVFQSLGSAATAYGLQKTLSGGYQTGEPGLVDAATAIGGYFDLTGGLIAGTIGAAVNRTFGRKLQDLGIEGTFGTSDGFDGNSYEFYKGGYLRSDKTKREALDPQTEDMLEGSFQYARIQMALLATSVGLGADDLATFTKSIKVSFKGLSAEDASKKLEEEFQKVRESMADTVLGTKEYSQVGETSLETLERLSTALSSINPAFELLGYNMFQTSLAGASAADMLAQKFGGVDAATQALSSYYDNYYSEFERNSAALKQIQGAFERLGISMPALTTDLTGLATNGDDARKQFRGLVDAARAAGDDDLFVGLMNLQSAFLSLTPSTQEAVRSVEAVAMRLANLSGSVAQSAGVSTAGSSAAAIKAAQSVLIGESLKPDSVKSAESNLARKLSFQDSVKAAFYDVDASVTAAAARVASAPDRHRNHEGGMYSSYGVSETLGHAWTLTGGKDQGKDITERRNDTIDSSLDVIGEVLNAVEATGRLLGINADLQANAGFAVRNGENSSGWADVWMDGKQVSRIDKTEGYADNDAQAFEQFVQEIKTAAINALLGAGGMTFDGVFSEAFLAAEQNYLTKVTTAWSNATAGSAEDLQVLANALTPFLDEQVTLGIELLRSQGKNGDADAAERTKALGEATAGLSEAASAAVTAAYDYNRQLEKQIKYQETLNGLSREKEDIDVALLRAKGLDGAADAAQRAIDLAEVTKGLGSSEAAAVTAAYDYNRQLEKQVAFNQVLTDLVGQVNDQEVALLRAYGDDSRADALETQRELADMTRGLTEAQRDSITVAYNYRKELERQATTVTERRGLESRLLELADNQSEIRRRELQAIQPANRALQTMVWRIEDLKEGISDLENSVKDFRDISKGLRTTASELLAGDGSPLTPSEKYAQVKGKFTATSALAASGDKTALEELSGLSKTFLEVSRTYNASGSAYTSDFNMVQSALAGGAVSADAKADVAQLQLDATKAQIQAAADLAVALGKLTEAFQGRFGTTDTNADGSVSLGEFKAEFKGLASDSTLTEVFNTLDTDGDDILSLLESGNVPEEASKNAYAEALREAGTALDNGFTALGTAYSTGSGSVSTALNTVAGTISSVATAISNMSVSVSVTVPSAPVVASAKGNVFTNGVVDRSTYFDLGLMGEAGPEAIMPLSRGPNGSLGVRVYAPQQNSQARAPTGSSDQALLEELRALRLEVKQLREQNNAGHSLNAQATTRNAQTVAGSVEKSSSKARYAAKLDRKVSLV